MMVLEAICHANCRSKLYNRWRAFERQQSKASNLFNSCCIENIAFAELTACISDVILVEKLTPVFKLVDLKNMYCNRLQQLDPMTDHNERSRRLKYKLLSYFSDMSAHTDGCGIVFAFNRGVGAALSRVCFSDAIEDAVH
jgi:hypothetical protein